LGAKLGANSHNFQAIPGHSQPAPPRIVLGSQALQTTVRVLKDRVASFEAQADLAASADFPPGE
jgi:hypothetical protein